MPDDGLVAAVQAGLATLVDGLGFGTGPAWGLDLGPVHLARPVWLLLIAYALHTHRRLRTAWHVAVEWQASVDPGLLRHLTVASARERLALRPYQLMTAMLILTAIALAGPSWQRLPAPFATEHAPLVIVLEATPGMLATDVAPTRFDRARHKVRDLLARRPDGRSMVIVYAGSAHALLPPTNDGALLETWLAAADPGLMPVPGDRPAQALALAASWLDREPVAGSIVWFTDGPPDRQPFDPVATGTIAKVSARHHLLAVVTGAALPAPVDAARLPPGEAPAPAPPGDAASLRAAGVSVVEMTPDGRDVDTVARGIRSRFAAARRDDPLLRRDDRGWMVTWLVAACALAWFRRGWAVRWPA